MDSDSTSLEPQEDFITVINSDWYQEMISDCRAINAQIRADVVESVKVIKQSVIEGKYALGLRITEERDRFGTDIYGKGVINQLAASLKMNPLEIYRCLLFVKKFPVLSEIEKLSEGQSLSWRTIVNKYLYDPAEKEGQLVEIQEPQFGDVTLTFTAEEYAQIRNGLTLLRLAGETQAEGMEQEIAMATNSIVNALNAAILRKEQDAS